jgi:hypothetical protein
MKKILCLFLLLCCATPISASLEADVKGSLSLKGKAKSSQSFLDLLKCGLAELPKKFLRKEKIEAEYSGGNFLTLEQTDENDHKLTVKFRVPSILRVASTKKLKKDVVKSGTVGVDCLVQGDKPDDNTGSSGDNFSSSAKTFGKHRLKKRKLARTKLQRKKNKINNFLRNGSTGLTFSVKQLVAVRKGDKGRLKGTFVRKKDKALGRFSINFKYEDTENSKKI